MLSLTIDDFVVSMATTSSVSLSESSSMGVAALAARGLSVRMPGRRVTCGLCDGDRLGDGECLDDDALDGDGECLDDDACCTGLSERPTATDGLTERLVARVTIGDANGRECPGDVMTADVDRVERGARGEGWGTVCCREWERRGLRERGGVRGRFDTLVGRGGVWRSTLRLWRQDSQDQSNKTRCDR